MSDNDRKIITHTITHLLSRREHSRKELLSKLVRKGLPLGLCEEQIAKFVENDIQSDVRFAESLIRGRVAKGQGENRVRQELREHNISDSAVSSALTEIDPDWFELARRVKVKKFGEQTEVDWQKKQKQIRFLQYRGFTHEQIQYAMEKAPENP